MLGWVSHLMSEGGKARCDGSRAVRRHGRRGGEGGCVKRRRGGGRTLVHYSTDVRL